MYDFLLINWDTKFKANIYKLLSIVYVYHLEFGPTMVVLKKRKFMSTKKYDFTVMNVFIELVL